MFYVYILLSLKDRKFYIGFTKQHPEERLKGHNKGNTNSTKKRRPFKLIYYEAHTLEKDARRREKYFKTSKGKFTLKQMLRTTLVNSETLKKDSSG
jgi:putative endonuclease